MIPWILSSDDAALDDAASDIEESTQARSASTTTPAPELFALKAPPAPKAVLVSATPVSTQRTSNTAAAASASTAAAIMKSAHQEVKAGHLWSFEGAGKFLVTPARHTVWTICPGRLKSGKFLLTHYFSKDGEDRNSIHDECNRAIPHAFTAYGVSSSSWRFASQEEILAFVTAMFVKPLPEWLAGREGNQAHCCVISLAKSRADKFDSLYPHGHLDVSTEGKFWLAANMVLGSRWLMTNPCASKKASKGPRKVAFHYGDATVAANQSGIFLRQKGTCSGNCQPPIDVTSGVPILHRTYITIGLPRLPLEQSQQENYLQSAQSLMETLWFLWAVDPEIVLYVFPTKARKNPTAQAVRPASWSNSIPDRTTLEIYAYQV